MSTCRVCGGCKQEQDLISDIYSVEANDLKLTDYISFYCRINLSRDPNLPTKVCRVCRMHLETFIAFCDNLNKVENGLIGTSKIVAKQEVIDVIKTEKISPPPEVKMEEDSHQPRNFRGGKSPIQNIMDLFAETLKQPYSEHETLAHITVEMAHVSAEGEISAGWLADFGVATWMDIVYKCLNCGKKEGIKSLSAFLNHLKHESSPKTKIKCSECDRTYSALNSYINHVTKIHHEHLSFCCIECGRIHFNIAALIKHYHREHPSILNIYPCIECGYYAQSFTQLKIHALGHKTQEVSDSSDEEPPQAKMKKSDSRISRPGPSSTSTPLSSMKNYHPKAFSGRRNEGAKADPGKNRKKYPCEQCDRVLLTHQGWIYHQLVHSNSKPFGCRTCTAAFRSKQACDEHEKACH